jgi:hypothetical protein
MIKARRAFMARRAARAPRDRFDLRTLSYKDFLERSLEALLSPSYTLMIAISGTPARFG